MSSHAALAARIAAAMAFALMAAIAAVSAPAWALLMLAAAGAGVSFARSAGDSFVSMGRINAGALAAGVMAVAASAVAGGLPGALVALLIWRLAAEALATDMMLCDLARRHVPAALDGGFVRAIHLAAAPAIAAAIVFGWHGGRIFGVETLALPMEAAVVIIAIASVALLDWTIRRLADWRIGVASRALTLHVGAHHVLFLAISLFAADGAALVIGLLAWRIMRFAPPLPAPLTASLTPTVRALRPRPVRRAAQATTQAARVVAR